MKRKGLSTVIGGVFFLIMVMGAAGYLTFSMGLLDTFSQTFFVVKQEKENRQNEEFAVLNGNIENGKFDIDVKNTGKLPINFTRIWIQNTTDVDKVFKFDINKQLGPGQTLNDLSNGLAIAAMDSQAYNLKIVTERGNVEEFMINSGGQQALYMQTHATPETIAPDFTTTVTFEVVNNMTDNTLLNLQPILTTSGTNTPTKISGPIPATYPVLERGDVASFKWVYTLSGSDLTYTTFNATLANAVQGNFATATATTKTVTNSLESGSSVTTQGFNGNQLSDDLLVLHEETQLTPNGAYQMYPGDEDGGNDGDRIQLDSENPSFFTNNGTTSVTIPAGNWVASLQLQSEAMPNNLIGEGEGMIFHFEDGVGANPDNSEGDSSRDLEACSASSENQQIGAWNDDAEENVSTGSMSRSSSDLEMPWDGSTQQIIGMRFQTLDIPNGATITNAYIQFRADSTDSSSVSLRIHGEDIDDAPNFSNNPGNISNRDKTAANVAWNPASWTDNQQGTAQQTPDISSIIQEIVNRPGWSNNNDIVIIIENDGTSAQNRRSADSVDGSSTGAPEIFITYSVGGGGSNEPTWQAGSGPHNSGSNFFDGNDCFRSTNNISSSDNNHLDTEDDSTALWFKTNGNVTSEQHMVFWAGDGTCPNCDYYKISILNGGLVLFEFKTEDESQTDITTCQSTNAYDNDYWYHVVAVRGDGSDDKCTLYISNVNGEDMESPIVDDNNYDTDMVNADGKWYVGTNKQESGNWFNGWIDDIIHWNDKALSAAEADSLSKTHYGADAHQIDFRVDKTDKNGVLINNLATELATNIAFQDPKGGSDNDDSTYSIVNVTMSLPQVDLLANQRLNFSMQYVSGTTSWEPLELDMKIDDQNITPYSSLIQIPMPNGTLPSYFVYDNDNQLEIWITNEGPFGSWLTRGGTRATFDDTASTTSYTGLIYRVNGTSPDFEIREDRDSIFIPVGEKAYLQFYTPSTHPSDTGLGTPIPAGTYDLTVWVSGYDDTGQSWLRSIKQGLVLVVD